MQKKNPIKPKPKFDKITKITKINYEIFISSCIVKMSLEFSNSSYDNSTERKPTPQGTEHPNTTQTVDTLTSAVDTTQTVDSAPNTTDTKEEDKKQKKFDELKKNFPGLESLFPLSQLKSPEVQNLLQTLDNFAKNFMDNKEVNQEKLFETRKLLDPDLVNTTFDSTNIPTEIKNIIENIKKLQNQKLSNFDISNLTTSIA